MGPGTYIHVSDVFGHISASLKWNEDVCTCIHLLSCEGSLSLLTSSEAMDDIIMKPWMTS